MKKGLVSIVIPTKNSGRFLENTLQSIQKQTYRPIETIIVDGNSTDNTLALAKEYHCIVYLYTPKVATGVFDAPHKRNYGAKKAAGEYVYYVDADMELPPTTIAEAVALCEKGFGAVILSEDSFGEGIWAKAKNLERKCYWGDDTIEAPRFFKKNVWDELGGLDESIGGGGDDWDLYQKLLDKGYKASWIKSKIRHNEGNLSLGKLFKKRFMYGRETVKYITKRPKAGVTSYFPIRKAYLKHWYLFLFRPVDSVAFVIMRTTEYTAGMLGILYSAFRRSRYD